VQRKELRQSLRLRMTAFSPSQPAAARCLVLLGFICLASGSLPVAPFDPATPLRPVAFARQRALAQQEGALPSGLHGDLEARSASCAWVNFVDSIALNGRLSAGYFPPALLSFPRLAAAAAAPSTPGAGSGAAPAGPEAAVAASNTRAVALAARGLPFYLDSGLLFLHNAVVYADEGIRGTALVVAELQDIARLLTPYASFAATVDIQWNDMTTTADGLLTSMYLQVKRELA
jgi:hypothetical protein